MSGGQLRQVSMTVNGAPVTATVEPRTHLADFLREQQLLTGTHLGCEQGVCGACTVVIDGEIARSCITFALACDGASVRTIESFDDDPVMAALREAFSAEHGLQCGYCTPGMLVTARDIVRRLPDADAAQIRHELSGNLCRCTGYVGIVRAVGRVVEQRRSGRLEVPAETAPTPSAPAPLEVGEVAARPLGAKQDTQTAVPSGGSGDAFDERGMTELHQSFLVHHPRDEVWAYMSRIEDVATCMPGVSLAGPVTDNHLTAKMTIKLGPISAAFVGEAEVERDDATYQGVIRGRGRDQRSASNARGRVRYGLEPAESGAATRVDVAVAYALSGSLAQFSRGGIVNDLANRMTGAFAKNLEDRLSGRREADSGEAPAAQSLDAGSLLFSVLGARLKAFFAKLFGRR